MTSQSTEIMIVNGTAHRLQSLPLESFFDGVGWRPSFCWASTAHRRGYTARWEVIGRRLYLTGLLGAGWIVPSHLLRQLAPDPDPYDDDDADIGTLRLIDLFPDENLPIPATWVTGILTVVTGGLITHTFARFGGIYASYRQFVIVQGRVRQIRDLSARQWARRTKQRYPEDWFDGEPDPPEPSEEVRPDWRSDTSQDRFWSYEAAQLYDLLRPSDQRPDPSAPWPRWRDQRRRARLRLTCGRR